MDDRWWRGFDAVILDALPPKSRVLDVGCGDGGLVRCLALGGLDAFGVDPRAPSEPRLIQERVESAGRRQRTRHVMSIAFLALGLVGVALLHVWLRLQVVHMGYVLSTTSKLQNQLEQENRELKVELATLTSPDRLEAMSRRRLGLRPPEKGQVIVLP